MFFHADVSDYSAVRTHLDETEKYFGKNADCFPSWSRWYEDFDHVW